MNPGERPALRVVIVVDLLPVGAPFVELLSVGDRPLEWARYSGLPVNALERAVPRPRVSRYRAAWQATNAACDATVLVSHLPRMSAAVADAARLRRIRTPHLAFSFNFTQLPAPAARARFRRSLASVQMCWPQDVTMPDAVHPILLP